jgi:hypothetical protein
MVALKVDNPEIWEDSVKTGKVKGFSIEGFFADKSTTMSKEEMVVNQIKQILKEYAKESN